MFLVVRPRGTPRLTKVIGLGADLESNGPSVDRYSIQSDTPTVSPSAHALFQQGSHVGLRKGKVPAAGSYPQSHELSRITTA